MAVDETLGRLDTEIDNVWKEQDQLAILGPSDRSRRTRNRQRRLRTNRNGLERRQDALEDANQDVLDFEEKVRRDYQRANDIPPAEHKRLLRRYRRLRAKRDREEQKALRYLRRLEQRRPRAFRDSSVPDPCSACLAPDLVTMQERLLRERHIVAMKELNSLRRGGENRFQYGPDYELPAVHWNPHVGTNVRFRLRNGVKPSVAIKHLFEGSDSPHYLECLSGTYVAMYKALLDIVGPTRFDQLFDSRPFKLTNKPMESQPLGEYYDVVVLDTRDELVAGDLVFFENHPDYRTLGFGAWQGENAVITYKGSTPSRNRYEGFGVQEGDENHLKDELASAFNDDYSPVTPLTRNDIPGLMRSSRARSSRGKVGPVFRPDNEAIWPNSTHP